MNTENTFDIKITKSVSTSTLLSNETQISSNSTQMIHCKTQLNSTATQLQPKSNQLSLNTVLIPKDNSTIQNISTNHNMNFSTSQNKPNEIHIPQASIYIEAKKKQNTYLLNLESLLIVYIYKICTTKNIILNVLPTDIASEEPKFSVDLSKIKHKIINHSEIPCKALYTTWPNLMYDNQVVAGLCSVARKMIKTTENNSLKKLLGFRESCLIACSETSIWTKFCEVDMFYTIKNLIRLKDEYFKKDLVILPKDFVRFEYHLEQPVKLHNIYKLARDKNKNKHLKSNIPINELNLKHTYAEGYFKTLSDVILFALHNISLKLYDLEIYMKKLPLTYTWYENLKSSLPELVCEIEIFESTEDISTIKNLNFAKIIFQEDVLKESLYPADSNRSKPHKTFTRQYNIEKALKLVENLQVSVKNNMIPYGSEIEIPRNEIFDDYEIVPKKRLSRKCDQLINLVKSIVKITDEKQYKIVDFCSGSGHLGIVLAKLLPKCHVILVENKEISLNRAHEHISALNLRNITILQCNLDYFNAKFDLGTSLHACGVATDLVLQTCILNKAHFVCCPCCYGGIQDCHRLKYPRSKEFSGLNYNCYLSMAHAADQTHDNDNVKTNQGYQCMDIVDTDRKLWAESNGYEVFLGKLQPVTCTPKNNLLVGICKVKQ